MNCLGVRIPLLIITVPLLAPRKDPDGLWNCSVPSWPDFRLHFMCDHRAECAGREDEMWCPYISCQQGGVLLNDRCHFFLRLPGEKDTWHHGYTACKWRGAVLASFPTVNSLYSVILFTHWKRRPFWVGLQSIGTDYSHMYRYSLLWHNSSISLHSMVLWRSSPPSCGLYQFPVLTLAECASSGLHALCQTSASTSVVNRSQKRVGEVRKQAESTFGNSRRKPFPLPTVSCPNQHKAHDFLAFDPFSSCCHDYDSGYSGAVSAIADNETTPVCADLFDGTSTFKALFPCQNGAGTVPYSVVCNHLQDCVDNSDENFCVFPPCTGELEYKCTNGQCLHLRHYCDEFVQCVDESDEVDCLSKDLVLSNMITSPQPPLVVDFDGRGWMVYTPLTAGRETTGGICPNTYVLCPGDDVYCLPVYVRCNGVNDCPGREDEDGCDSYTCPGLYRCRGLLDICLHPDHVCDGWAQCPRHDDELFCNLTCPVDCTCLGHAFVCTSDFHVELYSRLRYLDASGIGLNPWRLLGNVDLVHLSLANCDLKQLGNLTLPNLLTLDLSENRISIVTAAELNLMSHLRNLSLARNPLLNLFSGNYSSGFLSHKNILHIDVSGVEVNVLDVANYLPFPNLLSLNMTGSGVTRLIGEGFQSLTSLRILDLRGCPMTVFPKHAFKKLKNLRVVFADNYKLCCEANLPEGFNMDNCQAPFEEISSCDALLRADIYRISLSVLAALALTGNLGCFCLRIFSLTGRGKTGFNVFVTHLCVSDFMMGLYMAMIGVADRLYLGRYLWEEGKWRHSAACQVAGTLALLSCEVSAFIICLITFDRFLVIRFPFSRFRFSSFSAQVASLFTWTGGVVLVTVPLLPFTAYKHFYGQTGICVPLPVSRNDFSGHDYAFGVMILLNLVVFLIIAAGQISVYLSMTNNAMSSIDTTRKSRDLIVARRLITVVVSDFLCWFPLGLLGVLASQGVPVPGEVNVAMAIFVLPLNSALNPFLYTLNMIQEKRQRATEEKMLKMIMDRGINDYENADKCGGAML